MTLETALEKITGALFGLICHQDPAILMRVEGREFLLCPRCIGLHVGFLSSFIVMTLWTSGRIKIVPRTTRLLLAMAIGSMAVDWGLGGHLGLFTPTSFSRLTTGLICGSALSVLLTSYRRRMSVPWNGPTISLTGLQTVGLICFSLCVGAGAVMLNSWVFLSSLLLIVVIANAALAMHTCALFARSHRFWRTVVESSPSHKGGS
jgi:uncharacterized membrane protein